MRSDKRWSCHRWLMLLQAIIISMLLGFVSSLSGADTPENHISVNVKAATRRWFYEKDVNEQPEYPPPPKANLKDVCVLGPADIYVAWWSHGNGSLNVGAHTNESYFLDLSHSVHTTATVAAIVAKRQDDDQPELLVLSVAYSELRAAPHAALALVNGSLELLSLRGNLFNNFIDSDLIHTWSDFPWMPQLRELDLCDCRIGHLRSTDFVHMPGLQRLYMPHNRIETISPFVFQPLANLFHLDLSYNFAERRINDDENVRRGNPFQTIDNGLSIPVDIFRTMTSLLFLDMSYTRIHAQSAHAFSQLPPNLELLSLCYTSLPVLPSFMFTGIRLLVLDLSGNPTLAYNLKHDSLHALASTLHILAVDDANIKSLSFFCTLKQLRILLLSGNNINILYSDAFNGLDSLEMVDLSGNHLGNWYSPVFAAVPRLRLLKLHDNNINLVTTAMFRDFQQLHYLALGNNNFICACSARDLMDVAAANSRYADDCPLMHPDQPLRVNVSNAIRDSVAANFPSHGLAATNVLHAAVTRPYDVSVRLHLDDMMAVALSVGNMSVVKRQRLEYNVRMVNSPGRLASSSTVAPVRPVRPPKRPKSDRRRPYRSVSIGGEIMNFTFQLLDFRVNRYQCINSTSSLVYQLHEIANCSMKDRGVKDEKSEDAVISMGHNANHILAAVLGTVFGVLIAYIVVYYYWWYIRFVWMTLRNSAILGSVKRDQRMRLVKQRSSETSESVAGSEEGAAAAFKYDVFVSYCDQNRDWILKEFLPNMDRCSDIKVCLHERDFQIGLSILENIIHCMDESRCLLLVVSENFLLSQWCQFEMHLAQHRLLETRRDQLILILLEDIPRRKRPQTLHYLMRTKTYIQWPSEAGNGKKHVAPMASSLKMEQRQFWRRLKRALADNDWEDDRAMELRNNNNNNTTRRCSSGA